MSDNLYSKNDFDNVLAKMNDKELNSLVIGAVEVDSKGNILSYNKRESEITGRAKDEVLGKNFFTDVAPCTDTSTFKGKFDSQVVSKGESVMFQYVFDYNMKPTKVQVYMKKAIVGSSFWILVKTV